MAKNLVIVESPSKATTIKKFLGSSYEVVASNGHVRDLPKSQMGIDFENDFEPKYITIRGKGEILAKLMSFYKGGDVLSIHGSGLNACEQGLNDIEGAGRQEVAIIKKAEIRKQVNVLQIWLIQ